MRTSALILTVMAAAVINIAASSQDKVNPPRKVQKEESTKKIKDLQKERIATLKQIVEEIASLYQHSFPGISYEDVFEARLQVLEAELDIADKNSDRTTLYKKIVDVLKEYELFVKGQNKALRSSRPPTFFLKVKARRIEAEINLERAKAKTTK